MHFYRLELSNTTIISTAPISFQKKTPDFVRSFNNNSRITISIHPYRPYQEQDVREQLLAWVCRQLHTR